MDCVSPFLGLVCDGLKWAQKHIGYATNVKSEIEKLKEEMDKLNDVCADVDPKVVIARERRQHVKKQVDRWQSTVRKFKTKVDADFLLPLNCSCTVRCPNCWTRYKLGKKVVLEHKGVVANLIVEGKEYTNGTVVDPDLPSPVETNISSIEEEAKRLWDLEADINSKVETTKRECLLLPKREVEGWIKRVSEHKQDVSAIQKDFEEIEISDNWVQLSQRAENLLNKTEKFISEGQSFEDVADPSRPVILVEQAVVPTIGQDEVYARVLGLIRNGQVARIGIHGMGGVGKTTLLKRINNSFTESDFELIIWVSVSKDFTIGEIQQSIMKRCGMDGKTDTTLEMESKIRDFLTGKRYILLLDDVWEPLDLNSLGVPSGDNEVKSMILITSRSEGVCYRMQAKKVPINCLDPNEAWKLFREKVGEEILALDEIEEMAKQICDYCGGLPLALDVIGRAMSEKRTLPEWSDAKNTLEKHAPGFEDSEEKLFSRLKLSYDSLKNDTIRECFCYCALFREDWEINTFDLVSCWIGEGLFDDECDNIDAARNKGYTIIRDLMKVGLLKEVKDGKDSMYIIFNRMFNRWSVVMHDVLRDMALWIKKDEFKISKGRSGFGKISGKEARLGLTTFGEDDSMERQRKEELQFDKSAPNLSTLITTAEGVTLFTDDMLEAMNKLRVLHVYGKHTCGALPRSIGRLRDLRCLSLPDNATHASLEVLAELGSLRLLIMSIPYELYFKGGISLLSKLQAALWEYSSNEGAGISVSGLESLPCLEDLQLSIRTASFLKGLAHSPKLARCVSQLGIEGTDITCFRIVQDVGSMDRLKCLCFDSSYEMTEFIIDEEEGCKPNTLCNLTVLILWELKKFIEFRVSVETKNSLQYLKFIYISRCHGLRFAYQGWPLPKLKVLAVRFCFQLEEIFKIWGGSGIVFSALLIIQLCGCPRLKIICSDAFCFPSLQILDVKSCYRLKRLPRGVIQASKESLKEIRGSQRWWDELTWDSEDDKISLLPLFKAKDVKNI